MDPNGFPDLPWLAIVLSWLALMVLGFVWYAKWFPTGRLWMRGMGMDPDNMPPPPAKMMAVSMTLMLLGSFAMMFVFAHTNVAYEDAFGNTATGGKAGFELRLMDGVMGALFTWLGFIVPVHLNAVAFENKKWSVFFVNVGYYFIGLQVASLLIVLL